MDKIIKEYCIGCGLCQSLGKAELICNQKGYLSPIKGDEKWLRTVCPAGVDNALRWILTIYGAG